MLVLTLTLVQNVILSVEAYKPDVRAVTAHHGESMQEQLSITGRSTVPVDPDYDRIAHALQHEGLRNGRRLAPNGNHNAVDISRIRAGIDVRTTVSCCSTLWHWDNSPTSDHASKHSEPCGPSNAEDHY